MELKLVAATLLQSCGKDIQSHVGSIFLPTFRLITLYLLSHAEEVSCAILFVIKM